jgi:hypothetical protein
MGIDLKAMPAEDPFVVAYLGPQAFGKEGSDGPSVVAIRRTIGQAQALGLQESDIISAVRTGVGHHLRGKNRTI